MKILSILIFILVAMCSCKKTSNCYECTFGTINGNSEAPQTYCGQNPEQHQFKDNQGNPLYIIECHHE